MIWLRRLPKPSRRPVQKAESYPSSSASSARVPIHKTSLPLSTQLVAAGAEVFLSNAEASRRALAHLGYKAQVTTVAESSMPSERIPAAPSSHSAQASSLSGLLETPPSVVSVGLSLFAEELRAQAVPVTEVPWKPAIGNPASLYRVMADPPSPRGQTPRRSNACFPPVLRSWDFDRLATVSDCAEDEFLHSGPPLEWDRASGPNGEGLSPVPLYSRASPTRSSPPKKVSPRDVSPSPPAIPVDAVGPMAGVVSPSMWMFELVDPVHGNRALLLSQRGDSAKCCATARTTKRCSLA
jgi:hypothetical protein